MKKSRVYVILLSVFLAIVASLVALISVPAAVGLVLGMGVAIAVFYKPFSGLIIYIILLFIRPQEFIPQLAKLRIMLILATIILLTFFIHKIFRKEKISFLPTRQHFIMLLLLLIVPVSNIVNFRLSNAWNGFNEFLTYFLLFFIITNIVDSFDKLKKVSWTILVGTILISMNGLIMAFRGVDLIGNESVQGRIRWIGIFGDPNDFALMINSFLPFVLINLFEKSVKKYQKLVLLLIGALFLTAVYYTNSRGGFVALMLMIGYFAVKRWGVLRGVAAGLAFIAIGLVLAPSRMAEISPYGQSASGRVYAWIDGLVMLKSRPVFGIGYQNFELYHVRAAHSAYIECMAELGLVGYFTWIALLYTTYAGLRVIEYRDVPSYSKYARILQISLIGFLGSAIFLSQAYSPILYIIIALSTLVIHNPVAPYKRPNLLSAREFLTVALILGASIVLYKFLSIVYI
jgi:O-antigen ligase